MSTLYPKQQMLAFSFLADITSGLDFTKDAPTDVQKQLEQAATQILSDPAVSPYLDGEWKVATTPWVATKADGAGKIFSTNTTLILTQKNKIVIAVAGTNFVDNYDWFSEDLLVKSQVSWDGIIQSFSNGTQNSDNPGAKISEATNLSLSNTWNQHLSASGKKLVDDLREVAHQAVKESPVSELNVFVTGHSLGGAISPVLAQALWELRAMWAPTNCALGVDAYPFAGPTVGNQAFVDWVQPQLHLGGIISVTSTYNKFDIVPHGWNLEMMGQMHDLFVPAINDADSDRYGVVIAETIAWLTSLSEHSDANNYERWNFEDVIDGTVTAPSEALVQAVTLTLVEALTHDKNKQALADFCTICGIPDVAPFVDKVGKGYLSLRYFAKFLLILKDQHITQYADKLYAGTDFKAVMHTATQKALKEVFKKEKNSFVSLIGGMDVLGQLFNNVAKFKEHSAENTFS